MRKAARSEFEQKYTAEVNYRILVSIYREVCAKPHREPTTDAETEQPETRLVNAP